MFRTPGSTPIRRALQSTLSTHGHATTLTLSLAHAHAPALALAVPVPSRSPASPARPLHATARAAKKPAQMPPRPRPPPDHEITEAYLKGSGPGGQKINKTNSAVQLRHLPTGIVVKCQATRSRTENRAIARQLLADRLDALHGGSESRTAVVGAVRRKKAASAAKKKRRKYRKLEEDKEKLEGGRGDEEAEGYQKPQKAQSRRLDGAEGVGAAGVTAAATAAGLAGPGRQEAAEEDEFNEEEDFDDDDEEWEDEDFQDEVNVEKETNPRSDAGGRTGPDQKKTR